MTSSCFKSARDPVTGEYRTEAIRTIKDTANSVITYYGQTLNNKSSYSDPVWQIRMERTIGSITESLVAGNGEYSYAWSDRASLFPEAEYFNQYSTSFDGINDRIEFGNNFNFDHSNQWSLSFWIKPDNLNAQRCIYSKSTNDSNVYGWVIYHNSSGKVFIQARTSGSLNSYTGSITLQPGVWQHLVMTYNGGSNMDGLRVYVNGAVDVTPSSAGFSNSLLSGQTAMLGARNTGFYYSGFIDEVSIWSKSLSSNEVAEIYNNGSPTDVTAASMADSLEHFYRMGDGDTAPALLDNVNNVNGTMINMASIFSGEVA